MQTSVSTIYAISDLLLSTYRREYFLAFPYCLSAERKNTTLLLSSTEAFGEISRRKRAQGTGEDRSSRWTARQTGDFGKQEDRQAAMTDVETNRQSAGGRPPPSSPPPRPDPDTLTQKHTHTPVPPSFQTQRERTEPDKQPDKHQPD